MRCAREGLLAGVLGLASAWLCTPAGAQIAVRNQGYIPYSDPPISYRTAPVTDPVARLEQQLDRGAVSLTYEPQHGYLKAVLKLLDVPIDSQTLVFSKTSFQYTKISPEHPRALYFNDDVYVGSVHDGKAIEIVSFDPMQGAVFYLLDERQADRPVFQRAELDCTQCHIAAGTRGIPGVLLRSVYPTSTGTLVPSSRSFITDQESPLDERWGGWYVSGLLAADARHMGNSVASADAATQLVSLGSRFDSSAYLAPGSDAVALLVLAHQTQMHNLITLTNYKTRLALYSQSDPPSPGASSQAAQLPYVRRQFERPAEQLLRYMLFSDEAPLPAAGAREFFSSSPFAQEFQVRGPRDGRGRSLRDFDLKTRIFKHPCSYLIYSQSFDAIPEPAKGYIYHRLLEVLSGEDRSPDFAKLSADDRQSIVEILLATKQGLPQEWFDYAGSHHLGGAANGAPLAAAPLRSDRRD